MGLSDWDFSGLSFPELMSFQDLYPPMVTIYCYYYLSTKLSSSQIPVKVVSVQEESSVPLDVTMLSDTRTCSEGLKGPFPGNRCLY